MGKVLVSLDHPSNNNYEYIEFDTDNIILSRIFLNSYCYQGKVYYVIFGINKITGEILYGFLVSKSLTFLNPKLV